MAPHPPGQGRPRPGRHPQSRGGPRSVGAMVSARLLDRTCSGPARPTPTPRPPRPWACRCSGTSTRRSSRSWTRPARCCAPSWGTDNARTLPLSRDRVGGDGGGVRQHRPPGRRRRGRGQRPLRAADVRRRRPLRRRGRPGRARVGDQPVDVRARARRPPDAGRSSPPCTPRPRRGCAPTSPRSARARATPCSSSTPSPRIGGIELRADDWGIDVGYAGTQKCLGRRPGPRALHDQRPRLRAPGREAAVVVPRPRAARRLRRRGQRRSAVAGPTTTPRPPRWSRACTPG